MIDVQKLIEWLGSDGAIAGLENSDRTVSDLLKVAAESGISIDRRTKRGDIIDELVNRNVVRLEKSPKDLLAMTYEDLRAYFADRRVSRTELINLLSHLDVRVGSDERRNLIDFAAREISELGMYERVAKGRKTF